MDTIIALGIMFGPFIIIILALCLLIHLLHNSARKYYRSQGMSEEEIKERIRENESACCHRENESACCHRYDNPPREMSYLESMRIKGDSELMHVSPEAIILYENLTGKEMSYLESVAIREDSKLYHMSDTAIVMKRYGGR